MRAQRYGYFRLRLSPGPEAAERRGTDLQLYRPEARRLRGARPARRRRLSGRDPDEGRRRDPGLSANSVRRKRQALRARRPVRPGAEVHRRGAQPAQAEPSGRRRVGASKEQGEGGAEKAGLRSGGAVRPPGQKPRLRLQPRKSVAAGVRGRLPLRADAGSAAVRGPDRGRHGKPSQHGPAFVRRRGLRQDGGSPAGRLQGRGGGQAGGPAGPYHHSGAAALQHHQEALFRLRRAGGDAQPVPHRRRAEGDPEKAGKGRGGHDRGHPSPAGQGREISRSGPFDRGRGAALRGEPQGSH